MTKKRWLFAVLSLVLVSQLRSDPSDRATSLTARLALEVDKIRVDPSHPAEGRYAARRALDLLVLFRIQNPSKWPSVLSRSDTVAQLREYRDALPSDSSPSTVGTIAALLGEYDNAARLYTMPENPSSSLCGNAAAATEFGKAEFLIYLDFIRGRYREVSQAEIIAGKPDGILSVDVGSDRWCILYTLAARAFEELGDGITARNFACQAMVQSKNIRSSWNYYYPQDQDMLSEIENVVHNKAAGFASRCNE